MRGSATSTVYRIEMLRMKRGAWSVDDWELSRGAGGVPCRAGNNLLHRVNQDLEQVGVVGQDAFRRQQHRMGARGKADAAAHPLELLGLSGCGRKTAPRSPYAQ